MLLILASVLHLQAEALPAGFVEELDEDVWPVVKSEVWQKEGVWRAPTNHYSTVAPEPVREAGVVQVGGSPYFAVNGKPLTGLWGCAIERRFVRPEDAKRRLSAAPIELFSVKPKGDTSQFWKDDGEYDFSVYDRIIEESMRENPTAYLIVYIDAYPSQKWAKANPGELLRDETGETSHCIERSWHYETNYSFSSEKAAKSIEDMVSAVIAHCERAPYAGRIAGYAVVSGVTTEWLGWVPQRKEKAIDFSPMAKRGFAAFAKERYPQLKDPHVPTYAERKALNDGDILWDGKENLNVIAFYEFYSANLAQLVSRLCSHAKRAVGGRKIVGTYYGYSMAYGSFVPQTSGHFALRQFLDAKAVDFIMSPPQYSYVSRGPGCALTDMKPFRSVQNHGIVSVMEDDIRTHLCTPTGYMQCPNEAQTIELVRRNMGFACCRNQPFQALALTSGCEFDYPQFTFDAVALQTAERVALKAGGARRNAEVAIVVSEDTYKALPAIGPRGEHYPVSFQRYNPDGTVERGRRPGSTMLISWSFLHAYNAVGRIGAPVDYVLLEDLVDDPGDYRLYYFDCCLKTSPKFVKLAEKLRAKKCVILWTYAPGYVSEEGNSPANMEALTGLRFRRLPQAIDPELTLSSGKKVGSVTTPLEPVFAVDDGDAKVLGRYSTGDVGYAGKRIGEAVTVFSGTYRIEPRELMSLARKAGVHLYSETLDPVEANDRFVVFHARTAGPKTIRLPRKADVVDVFGRCLVAKGVDTFSFEAPLHKSWLFCYGDDAEKLVSELKTTKGGSGE